MNFYQFVQHVSPLGGGIGTYVELQILAKHATHDYVPGPSASNAYYLGTAGGHAYTNVMVNGGGSADAVMWKIVNPSGTVILTKTLTWPSTWDGFPMDNPVPNFQNVLVGAAYTNTIGTADYYSGAGQFTFTGPNSIDMGQTVCTPQPTAENSDINYNGPSCGSNSCTQTFSATSGYEAHNGATFPSSFPVSFGEGWGTTGPGVLKGDLLVAMEATYSGTATFNTPTDSPQGNTWHSDGSYCSTTENDCVAVWHAIAKSTGSDTVTLYTTNSGGYTYGFIREFINYTGTTDASIQNFGSSGAPQVPSFPPNSNVSSRCYSC